jgi:putative transcriptional regulator
MREDLIPQVIATLKEAGFIVSSRCETRSFDLAARRSEITLLAKILHNIDGLSEEVARSIKRAAFCLLASPIVVGERKGNFLLEDDVIYHRYGIPTINTHTLHDYFVGDMHPYVYSATGGLYVTIDGEALKKAREKKEYSLGDVASELGVSRRSVCKYEEGGASTTLDIALKLEEILDTPLIEQLDLLQTQHGDPSLGGRVEEVTSSLEKSILRMIEEIGFEIITTDHAPFSAVSFSQPKPKEKILTGISKYTERMVKRAKIVSSLSRVTKSKSVFVVNGNIKLVQIDNTVLIEKDELKKIRDPEEFTSVMEERLEGAHKNS